jgi:oligopeptide/dipeptide ABC transporter ATP-binding protein
MYLGRVVEVGPVQRVYQNPQHPYTRALLADIPVPDPEVVPQSAPLTGEVPSPLALPAGCAFHPRCWLAQDVCRKVLPPLLDHEPGHRAACHVTAAQIGVSVPATLVPDNTECRPPSGRSEAREALERRPPPGRGTRKAGD